MSVSAKALVTGASSGIGQAVARRLLAGGYGVVGIARHFRCVVEDEGFHPVHLDLSQLEPLPRQLESLADSHPDVEVVVLNAGRGEFGSLEEFSYGQIRALMDLNFISQAYVARAFVPAMKRRGGGHVVFLGSEAALAGRRRGSVYCASKFAVRGFAQALREESARSGLRVTLINPGPVKTRFFDRLDFAPGESEDNYILPEEVAEAVWLALSTRSGTVLDEINLSPLKRVIRSRGRDGSRRGGEQQDGPPVPDRAAKS